MVDASAIREHMEVIGADGVRHRFAFARSGQAASAETLRQALAAAGVAATWACFTRRATVGDIWAPFFVQCSRRSNATRRPSA